VIRAFLSHAGADRALTEGAIELLSGFFRTWIDSPPRLLRARIELPPDIDRFSEKFLSPNASSNFAFVLFSQHWKITNAVRLARRLSEARPRSAVLCEEEWAADPRNLEPFSDFEIVRCAFEPEELSKRIANRLEAVRAETNPEIAAPRSSSLFTHQHDIAGEAVDDPDGDDDEIDAQSPGEVFASMGVSSLNMPSLEELMIQTDQTDWDPDVDPDDEMVVDPGVVATMRRLAEEGYGLEDEDVDLLGDTDKS
jgi:hypothetical protein